MLVQFAFFGAYTVGSLAYYVISVAFGDPINRIGYKCGVIVGLLLAALGSALFYPAASQRSYPFFLFALFIVGLGFALLQIAANPYVAILGPERTASSRLNLSQGVNSFGTTIGPIIGGWLIFNVFTHPNQHGAESTRIPYLCFSAVFVLLAIFFKCARLPEFKSTDTISRGLGALKVPHTVLGMLAIFMYVGGEVAVGSAIVNFLGTPGLGGISSEAATRFLAFYWGGLMIGRFMGAAALSELGSRARQILMVSVPLLALCVVALAAGIAVALHFCIFLLGLLCAFLISTRNARRMLALFAIVIIGLLVVAMLGSGELAKWCVLSVGLFCSIMWSNIFSLAIEGLGALKSQASSLLIMGISGGAILPPLQGAMADHVGIQYSFIVPALAFAYVAFYGFYGCRIGRNQVGE